ncbi:MAG: hypothetical protein GY871_04195 [Actinomycetales bacterium]|nr:hypothetical protein [Actinomycetales bacterium]
MTPEEQEVKVRAFLRELAELCKRHGAFIGGGGCCGSPFLDFGPKLFLDDLRVEPDGTALAKLKRRELEEKA